jgi:hypothetical protein
MTTQLNTAELARNRAVEMMLVGMPSPVGMSAGAHRYWVESLIDAIITAAREDTQYSGLVNYVTADELSETVECLDERLQSSTKRGHPSLLAPTVVLEMARLETTAELTPT